MEVRNGREGDRRRKVKPEGGKETRLVRETGGERVGGGGRTRMVRETGGGRMGGGDDKSRHPGLADSCVAHEGVGEEDAVKMDGDEAATQIWRVPDGGWGWVVVLSAMVISLIVDGLSYTFGLFLGEFERAFDQPKSTVALASSLQVGVYLFIGPVVSALTNRFGCRPIIVTGSCLAGLAFVISSKSNDVTTLILTYGLVAGVGFGLMYLPSIVAVSIYFEKRRAVATGIAVCGTGVGTFLMAPLTDYLLQEYNWRGTLLILAGIILNGAVFGALVRPLRLQRGEPCLGAAVQRNGASGASQRCLTDDEKGGLIKTPHNGKMGKEEVPLISLTSRRDNMRVTMSPGVEDTNPNTSPDLFFSSTPAMTLSPASILSKVELEKGITEIFPSSSPMKRAVPPRRRTQSSSDHTHRAVVSHARSHAPIGLVLISLSDLNLEQIRADVKLPLSRRDIHLSGPLNFQESDARVDRPGRGLYIQSVVSIASLSALERLEVTEERSGLWSCLPRSARETMDEMMDLGILKDKRLWYVLMGNFLCMLGIYVPFVYVPQRALQLGIPEEKAAILISIIGITNTIGRVMAGVLINFLSLDSAAVTSSALVIAGVITVICPFCHSYPALAVVSAVYGLCVAAYISLCSVLLCELFGVESLTNAFGFVILFRGMACMMGPPIAGAIIDATGLFEPSFYLAGGVIVLGGLSHALLLVPCSRRRGVGEGL